MAKNKFMEKLLKLEGAVIAGQKGNPHLNVIGTPSPSLNFTFGNGQGLPRGYSMLLYGPPRGGKSIICNAMIGDLHRNDPTAYAIKFNTEFREEVQGDDSQQRVWGIDPNRYICYEVNQPDQIFDRIEKEFAAFVQDGMNLGLIIIDSLNNVQGRRQMNAETIMTQQIGDNAATIQEGLKRIMPVQRKCNFALVVTSHIRAQMDTKTGGSSVVHTSHSTAVRPGVSFGVQHHCEYYMYTSPAGGADNKADLLGNKFIDENLEDVQGNAEKTGHKVRVRMTDNSIGPKGREGVLTLDYHKGIINVHEEVFQLGRARNIIQLTGQMYRFGDKEWRGKEQILTALKEDPGFQKEVLTELKKRDMAGFYQHENSVVVENDS